MAQAKKKKSHPPPRTSSPTNQPEPAESPAPVCDIEVPESQSDIPSISQATTGNELVKQPSNIENNSDQPSKKRKQTSDIWDQFTKKGTVGFGHCFLTRTQPIYILTGQYLAKTVCLVVEKFGIQHKVSLCSVTVLIKFI
ncbi:hypothetical protein PSTT_03620 [Puccinia striiformis]|uniref:Uncharacterized protein n=1 Tax=Puccinia striiformis TaxID=27350 RepID=A0A2S4VVS8_9BASI|nr:hypothetical protein PSTT_03620 [Puccinia striiformis]